MPDNNNQSRRIYPPAWDFLEGTNVENVPHLFAAKAIIKRDVLTREIEIFRQSLQRDLATYPTELKKTLDCLAAIEAMNIKHPIFFRSAHVDEVEFITNIERISFLVPDPLKIPSEDYQGRKARR